MRSHAWWLLIAALLLPAASHAAPLEFSVAALGNTPLGAVVVRSLTEHCRQGRRDRCEPQLRRWLSSRKLHPLTRAAAQRELAQELRAAGDREAGSRQTRELHYLRSFSLAMPTGEAVTLHADPVSGLLSVADFVELSPDLPRSFRATLYTESEQSVWLLVTGSHLESLCVGGECTAAAPMVRLFPDQFAVRATLVPAPASNELELVFSAQAPAVRFGLRIVDGGYRPVATESLEDAVPPAWQIRAARRSRLPEGGVSGPLAWLPEAVGEPPLHLLLARCAAALATGRSAGEAADQLLAHADRLSEAHWGHFAACLAGDEREMEALKRARQRFPANRHFTIAEAAYRSRQRQTQRAWRLLAGLGQVPSMEGFSDGELSAVVRTLRTVLPTFGLARVLQLTLHQAARRQPDDGGLVVAAAEQLVEAERHAEAVAILAPFVARWPGDAAAASTLAYVLDRLGRFAEESAVLERLSWLYPTRTLTLESLASARERAGDLKSADELHLTLAEKGRYQPYLLGRAASYFLRSGDSARAIKLWQQVTALQPQNREVRALVRRLLASGAPAEEVPLASDEERRQLANKLPQIAGVPRQGVLDRSHLRLYENGAHVLRRTIAIVVREEGAGTPFDFRFTYDSHLEEAVVSRAEILRLDGSIAPATESGDLSLSSDEYNLYYDLRQMVVRFDSLQAGDLAVVTYEIEADPSSLGGPFSGVVWLQDDYSKHNVELAIALPTGKELYSAIGPIDQSGLVHQTIDDGDTERTWRFNVGSLKSEKSEPFPPGPFERSLYVHYSTVENWQQFVAWYAAVIAHVGGLDAAMERLLGQVTEGTDEPREVAEAIARYVADEVRYVGLELGVHGLRPYPPQEVFARGFGDCKDKSLLYVTLLGAAGINARLVVLPTLPRGRVELNPGSPSIFNHAIVYLPDWDIFFDPTARYLGLGILPWQDQGAEALIVDPDDPRRVELPVAPYTDTVALFELDVATAGDGGLAVTGTLTFGGQFAWRLLAAMEQQGSWQNTVESYLSSMLPVVEVTAVSERVERGESPAVVVDVEGLWRWQDKGGVQLLPDGNAAFALVRRPERTQPLVFGYPYQHDFRVTFAPGTLTFPDGGFDASQSEEAAWRVAVEGLEDGSEQVTVRFEQRARRIPVERYQDYRTLVVRYQEALARLQGRRVQP